ncbi:MAG: LacI family DNA-binding transcriptional regulator [Treponemataceae bacterium]
MNVRLKEISDATSFSVNTVSRALRGDSRISEATRAAISRKAEELGYIPNTIAGSMRSNRSRTIGVVSADSSNPFFAEVILGIEAAARKLDHHILLINTEERSENERDAIKLLLGRQVDGLVVIPVYDDPKNLRIYESLEIPFIFAGRRVRGIENHSILHGDSEGQKAVFDYLLNKGHRKILYIAGPKNISNSVDRFEGYSEAFRAKGLEIDPDYVLESSGHIEDGYAKTNMMLNRGLDFSAIVCFNDLLAMGVLKSLHENDRAVPGDVEVFGFDNLYISQFMRPSLSSVDVSKALLGRTAVEELIRHIEDPQKEYRTLRLEPRLVFRETTSNSIRNS